MKLGMDYIGGANYPKRIARRHPKGMAAGFLCRASGWENGIKAARMLAESDRNPEWFRFHGLWKDGHDFENDDVPIILRQAEKVARFREDFSARVYFSPMLEHRASESFFIKVAKQCREILPPSVLIVSSGATVKNYITEVHHGLPVAEKYLFSYDGLDMRRTHVPAYRRLHRHCDIFWGWIPEFNGLESVDDTTPRPDRTNWPKVQEFREVKRLLRGR